MLFDGQAEHQLPDLKEKVGLAQVEFEGSAVVFESQNVEAGPLAKLSFGG